MVIATDLFHMMDDPGGPSHINFDEPVSTFDARYLIDSQLLPTKGNVIVGDGANWDVLAIGADTEVLTADAAQALGVKWAAAGGGGALTVEEQDAVPSVANVTKIKVTNGSLTDDGGGVVSLVTGGGGGADEKVKVSVNDTVAGYLDAKLVAGANITLTEIGDGGDEDLSIAVSGLKASDLTTLWEPLTNGVPAAPELIFADGDVVMVEV